MLCVLRHPGAFSETELSTSPSIILTGKKPIMAEG